MIPKSLALLTLLALAGGSDAAVYRCETTDGRTVYSDEPCGDGKLLDIPVTPRDAGQGGLRPGELEFLRQRERQREERERQARERPPPAEPLLVCAGASFSEIRFVDSRETHILFLDDGQPVEEIDIRRCAETRLTLRGYAGRLRESAAEELGRRLIALFPDRSAVRAEQAELRDGPDRLGTVEEFSGRFCFGYHPDDILRLECL